MILIELLGLPIAEMPTICRLKVIPQYKVQGYANPFAPAKLCAHWAVFDLCNPRRGRATENAGSVSSSKGIAIRVEVGVPKVKDANLCPFQFLRDCELTQ